MLKPVAALQSIKVTKAATFGWLCVETLLFFNGSFMQEAATFGWLCVETAMPVVAMATDYAATFGWLCVETLI